MLFLKLFHRLSDSWLCLNHVRAHDIILYIHCEGTPAQRSPADTFFQSQLRPKREIRQKSSSWRLVLISVVKLSWPLRVHCGPSVVQTACMVSRSGCWGSVGPPWLPSEQGSDWGSALQLPSHPPQPPSVLILSPAIPERKTVRE